MKPRIEIRASLDDRIEYINRYGEYEEVRVWVIESILRYPGREVSWKDVNTIAETQCEKVKDIIVEAMRKAVEEGRYE